MLYKTVSSCDDSKNFAFPMIPKLLLKFVTQQFDYAISNDHRRAALAIEQMRCAPKRCSVLHFNIFNIVPRVRLVL